MREGGFASPTEGVDEGGLAKLEGVALPHAIAACAVSPSLAARQTARHFGLVAIEDGALADIDHGLWSGRSFADVHDADPEGFAGWLAEPLGGAPGGETLSAVQMRVGGWLALKVEAGAPMLGITHPMVIRAAIAAAMDMPLHATLRIDIAPLTMVRLSWNRMWRLQSIGPLS